MCRHPVRIQFDVVARPVPDVVGTRQQIVHLKRLVRIHPQRRQIQTGPTGLRVVGIQVHQHQNDVGVLVGGFAVADDLLVIDLVKPQAPVGLQRRIALANTVQQGDEVAQAVRSVHPGSRDGGSGISPNPDIPRCPA